MGHWNRAILFSGLLLLGASASLAGPESATADAPGNDDFTFAPLAELCLSACLELPGRRPCGLAVGDADNDGENELLIGTSPDSSLYVAKYDSQTNEVKTTLIEEELAGDDAQIGNLCYILVDDLNNDGCNEIAAMTDQEAEDSNMRFWVFHPKEGDWIGGSTVVECPSHWTHGLAALDTDNDGIKEVYSTHCGFGEIFRYNVSPDLSEISYKKIKDMWAAGESLEIADVFNDGQKRLVVVQGDNRFNTAVKIYGFADDGLGQWPEACLDSHMEKRFWDATTCTGDLDNDGRNELVVAWLDARSGMELTLVAYNFDADGHLIRERPLLEFENAFGRGSVEGRMCIGKLGSDTQNRLYLSRAGKGIYECTLRGDNCEWRKLISSETFGLGLIKLGDVDNDSRNELIVTSAMPPEKETGCVLIFDKVAR